ncbi:bifunctional MaoC family dehydratase N-terminal/OB-fold nucleic acid binding domain-containing protein [Dietzia psychralcaliphila]|uniref:bifunctional MaoC family dehydratase N-terminal/OB-fold nucleic acid binding domain-containing protein n=1 Tax=Dietzia psychralcaliphila TaxID=139021 RepID=UPI001C1E455A|nr:bifunctional MaoC family dehydratase N-terminal/OB-fold nucleic acid binding domain-containing protein [Dietzia psychralcaliphila]
MSDDTVDDTATDERAGRILAAADEVRAAGGSARRAGRDPVNLPMIRNWTEAIGDANPIYSSEDAARAAGHGGPVAPPAMAQVWTMRGLGKTREGDDPLGRMTDILDAEGFTSVVATNCDSTYHRYTRPGEEITIESVLTDVVGPKTTGLGEGWFFTTRNYWRVGDEVVAEMDFRILKFRPAAKTTEPAPGDTPAERIVASSGSATDDLVVGKVLRPSVSHDTRFFWDGVRAHELRIQTLEDGSPQHPPVPALWKDKTEQTDYTVSSGRGTVFSFVTHHAPRVPGRTRFPFVIALVELEEGVRMLGELRDVDPGEVRIGMEVEVEFLDMPGDPGEDAAFGTEPWTLYAWRPAGTPPVTRQMPEVREGAVK